ncbi:MAG: hypothetical protein SPK18_08575 [Treponema sp.]|nr:hypothetical protein [Spirochaetia bacterium]MDD7533475.1 hypothetical protein [Treponema sp.]MDY5758619.1 hypothetical protein [Treponema sp.]
MSISKLTKSLYFMIALGILILAACFVFAVINPISRKIDILNLVILIFQGLLGIVIIIIGKKITHKFFHMFIGLAFFLCSLVLIMMVLVLPFTIKELWPVYGVIAGISLFISGFLKYKSVKFGYLIPAVTLVGMGIWYLMFSLQLMPLSFSMVVYTLGPAFLIMIAVLLVAYFFVQQKHSDLVFKDDEIGVFSDEEASFKSDMDEDL